MIPWNWKTKENIDNYQCNNNWWYFEEWSRKGIYPKYLPIILILPPSQVDERDSPTSDCCYDWTFLKYRVQMYIQHLWDLFPSRFYHPDQTTINHTWDLHEEPPGYDPKLLCDQAYQLTAKDHHANKIWSFLPMPSVVNNQINRWNISTHLHWCIFEGIHHKSHTLVWFVYFHDFLVISLFDPWIAPKPIKFVWVVLKFPKVWYIGQAI